MGYCTVIIPNPKCIIYIIHIYIRLITLQALMKTENWNCSHQCLHFNSQISVLAYAKGWPHCSLFNRQPSMLRTHQSPVPILAKTGLPLNPQKPYHQPCKGAAVSFSFVPLCIWWMSYFCFAGCTLGRELRLLPPALTKQKMKQCLSILPSSSLMHPP